MRKDALLSRPGTRLTGVYSRSRLFALVAAIALCLFAQVKIFGVPSRSDAEGPESFSCDQEAPLRPQASRTINATFISLDTPEYRAASAQLLSGAVQIASISYDDMGLVGEDIRWEVFHRLSKYLQESFPLAHRSMALTRVDTHGLIYTWQGTDQSLKPVVLMAHQDVVPVDSLDLWTYPPFNGTVTQDYVYGRGASDCKNILIGLLEAIEKLLTTDFVPQRTIILAFGTDEESKGLSALQLSQHLEAIYGRHGIQMILDEGSAFEELYGQMYAVPGIAEKGYLDAIITISMPGGHSSIPPDHTAIGILSQILVEVERDTYDVALSESSPLYQAMVCTKWAPNVPKDLQKLVQKRKFRKLAKELSRIPAYKYLMATSIAETVIHGGVKVNALPESASATVNHRISIDESSRVVQEKLTKIAASVAARHKLTLNAFDGSDVRPESINIQSSLETLDPAPVTPIDTEEYALLSGTIRASFPDVYVAPGMSTGNTDTKSYWNLSRNIFRFEPSTFDSRSSDRSNIHTINERMSIDGHLDVVRFYYLFIQNVQHLHTSG